MSRLAEADLEEIGDYIARDSREGALSFVRELRDACALAAKRPSLYRRREDLAPGIRSIVRGRYLTLFRELPELDAVRIERVLHGARDIGRLV